MDNYFNKDRAASLVRSGFNWDDTVILMDMSSEELTKQIINEFDNMQQWNSFTLTIEPFDKKMIKICRDGIQNRLDKIQKAIDDKIAAQKVIDEAVLLKEKEEKKKAENLEAISKLPDVVGETIRHIGNKKFLTLLMKFNEVLQGTVDDTKVESKIEYVVNEKKVKIHLKN